MHYRKVSGLVEIDWRSDSWGKESMTISILIMGTIDLVFKNPVEGSRLTLIVSVDESINGTVKINFPDSTWTPRGPSFNIQPGLIGVYEIMVVGENTVLINDRQVS